jgi:hypothetical protein
MTSDRPIPRRIDLREHEHPDAFDLEISRDGAPVFNAVAYDLDAKTLTLLKMDEHGKVVVKGDAAELETIRGDFEVRWRTPTPQERRF